MHLVSESLCISAHTHTYYISVPTGAQSECVVCVLIWPGLIRGSLLQLSPAANRLTLYSKALIAYVTTLSKLRAAAFHPSSPAPPAPRAPLPRSGWSYNAFTEITVFPSSGPKSASACSKGKSRTNIGNNQSFFLLELKTFEFLHEVLLLTH